MIKRKNKLKLIQVSLLLLVLVILFSTYLNKNINERNVDLNNIVEKNKNNVNLKIEEDENIFYNIEYSGIDLSGNRYILRSKEARSKKLNQEIINMKEVNAIFYFKDGSILNVNSKFGIYNNQTLDMKFNEEIVALYNKSKLYANNAEYLNSEGSIKISDNVKVIDAKGNLDADFFAKVI
tara:strand:- start:18 stop:557 length:540 start_codon:yes stop_codon:yes gene_type:complete